MLTATIILFIIAILAVCVMLYVKHKRNQKGFLILGTVLTMCALLAPIIGILCGIASLVMFVSWCKG